MNLTRAFSTLGCPQFTLEQALGLARQSGIPAIELRALAGSMDLPAYFQATYGSPDALAAQLTGSPVAICALNTSLRLIGSSSETRADFLRFLPWAEALGVRSLRVFDGGSTAGEAELAEARDTVRWWRELRGKHGWRADISVETHDSLITSERIARFVERAPGIPILWDAHHTWKRGGEDPQHTWARCREAIVHIHVKDSVPSPAAKAGYSYVLPGRGDFPAPPLFAALREARFGGPVSLEWERLWHADLPSLEDALAAADNWGW